MDKSRRRALQDAYKERKTRRGVYAIRCGDKCWVSASRNLGAQQTSAWFTLRHGSHPNRAMQAAWAAQGEEAFTFEVLAELTDDEASAYAIQADLKAMEAEWRERLGADRATG